MNNKFLPLYLVSLFLLFLINTAPLHAQCNPDVTPPLLDCKTDITASLNIEGNVRFTYINVSNTIPWDECDGDSLDLNYVFQVNNEPPDSNFFTKLYCEHLGTNTLTMWVTDQSGNTDSCTINVTIEDNFFDPIIVCTGDTTLDLLSGGQRIIRPEDIELWSVDNCQIIFKLQLNGGPRMDSLVLDCNNLGSNAITLSDIDSITQCVTNILLMDPLNTCNTSSQCSNDTIPPSLLCHTAVTVALDINGTAIFNFPIAASQAPWDICDGTNLNYLYQLNNETPSNSLMVDCDDIGSNTLNMWVSDQSGNTDSCTIELIVEDKLNPVMICDITSILNMNSSLSQVIYAEDFDNGSYDNCEDNLDLVIQINGGPFADSITLNCSHLGSNTITLGDKNSNAQCVTTLIFNDPNSFCPNVCALDTIPPELFCKNNLTVALGATGTASLFPGQYTTITPWDNCDQDNIILSYQLNNEPPVSGPLTVDCSHLGQNTVTVEAIDQSGNAESCIIDVEVVNLLNPILICEFNLSFDLPASGNLTLYPSDFDEGSWGNCGPPELEIQINGGPFLDSITIDCSYVGEHSITLRDVNSLNACWTVFTLNDPLNACIGIDINGQVFSDTISNCLIDNGEEGLSNVLVQIVDLQTNAQHQTTTDSDGNYTFNLSSNPGSMDRSYSISLPDLPGNLLLCGASQSLTIPAMETSGTLDFPVFLHPTCPLLTVDISTPVLRSCFDGAYYISYCNYSATTIEDPFIIITFDDLIDLTGSSIPWTSAVGNEYRFELPDLAPLECGSFVANIKVDCGLPLQQTLCTEAVIEPYQNCNPVLGNWSGAEIVAESFCNGTEAGFILKNIGIGDMVDFAEYVIVEDMVMFSTKPYQLNIGEELMIPVNASGSTWRIEADQEMGHPGTAKPIAWIEGCGGINTPGMVTIFPTNVNNPNASVFCLEITGSYDPNDKQGFPRGWDEDEHYIEANLALDYLVRFQNTGTDTAFTVVITDTLDQNLNFASIRPGASSHPYTFEISEEGIINFTFDNILLPDSTINEPGSHGFVKFKINQMADLPEGTILRNRAGIYFDFNEVVLTNTTWHTIEFAPIETALSNGTNSSFQIRTFPNPFSTKVNIQINGQQIEEGQLILYDLTGRKLLTKDFSGNQLELNRNHLPSGIYWYKIQNGQQNIGLGKLIVQ